MIFTDFLIRLTMTTDKSNRQRRRQEVTDDIIQQVRDAVRQELAVKGGVKVFHCGGGKGDHFFFF